MFQYLKAIIVTLKAETWKIVMGCGNKQLCFDKARKVYPFFIWNSIILVFPLLDLEDVSNILLLKRRLLPVETEPHSTRLESGTLKHSFPFSLTPITKHSDRYMLTVPLIIDYFMFGILLPCNVEEWKFQFHCSTFVNSILTIDRDNDFRDICY
jgi:hypothetical protein